jgi:ABC-type transport system substrate-binding protein
MLGLWQRRQIVSLCLYTAASSITHLAVNERLYASETPWTIYGWPLAEKGFDDILLNQDALMGTYVCPALSRLNLKSGASEPMVLSKITAENGNKTWILTLGDNARWAGGKAIDPSDLAAFISAELSSLVDKVLGPGIKIPQFSTRKDGKSLVVTFEAAPEFGPFIFNRSAFFRRVEGKIECAGPFEAREEGKDLVLERRSSAKPSKLIISRQLTTGPTGAETLSFRFGNELHPPTWERQIEEELSCKLPLDLPVMTMIAWNPEGRYTRLEEFRRAITSILPRGALLRAGAGSLGDLISAPILRSHPGYKKSILVMPYDLKKADAILNGINLVRSEKDGYRRTATGEVLEISIATDPSQNAALLRKILDDSFRALGMRLTMVDNKAKADGILTGIQGNWPENDIAPILHSRQSGKVWPWRYNFPDIDSAILEYNLSLTQQRPDFTLLSKIHELVTKREPFSVLVQHKSCMQYGKSGKAARSQPNIRDPDWIRSAILL